jgi:hypothetical protein
MTNSLTNLLQSKEQDIVDKTLIVKIDQKIQSQTKKFDPKTNFLEIDCDYGYSLSELKNIQNDFVKEIKNAKQKLKTSLNYQLNKIKSIQIVPQNKVFQVIFLGGSHIESALVKVKNSQAKFLSFKEERLDKITTEKDFFELIGKYLDPKIKFLSLNLAYPLQTIYRKKILDGVLVRSPKEHELEGLIGKSIGKSVEEYIFSKFKRKITVIACNNNTSLAFASQNLINSNKKKYLDLKNNQAEKTQIITGVVASGVNFGFFEQESFVNLESGNFDKFKNTFCGKIINQNSSNHNQALLEKEIASSYLWKHFNHLSQKLNLKTQVKSHQEMLGLLQKNDDLENNLETQLEVKLVKKILETSASLVASKLSAIIKYKNQQNNTTTLCKFKIVIEGSLFWENFGENSDQDLNKHFSYKKLVEKYLKLLGVDLQNLEFVRIKSGFILGSAKLIAKSAKILSLKVKIIEKILGIKTVFSWFSNSPPVFSY